jgi:hypothetical protein
MKLLQPRETFSGVFGTNLSFDRSTHRYLTLKVDGGEVVEESQKANNTAAAPTIPQPSLELTLVDLPTTGIDPVTGQIGSLPTNLQWMDEWAPFYVEFWIKGGGFPVSAASLTFDYNTQYFTPAELEYGPACTENQSHTIGDIDDALGTIGGLGANTSRNDAGDDGYALLARIRFETTGDDQGVPHNASGEYVSPVDHGFAVSAATVTLVGDVTGSAEIGERPTTQLWPVMFDVNDNGLMDFGDLSVLASAFGDRTDDFPAPSLSSGRQISTTMARLIWAIYRGWRRISTRRKTGHGRSFIR